MNELTNFSFLDVVLGKDKKEYEENVFVENFLFDLNVRGLKLEVLSGIGSILSVGKDAEDKLLSFVERKGIKINNLKKCGRLGFSENKGTWEYHTNMSMTNAHDDNWKRFGSEDDGRGYYVLDTDKIIICLKTNEDKAINIAMSEFLVNMKGIEVGNSVERRLKGIINNALERSKGDNKKFIDILLREGLSSEFLNKYFDYIKSLIKKS